MANPEHVAKLREGVAAWNAWREQNPAVKPDLSGADLKGIDFGDANLSVAKLDEAVLSDADLSHVRGLGAPQMRGADLTGAKLPDSIVESLKKPPGVDEASKNSRQLFLIMLVAALYCWITIFSTTDAALLLGSTPLALPIVQTPIPVGAFFGFAPVLLLAVYIYMHFSFQNLWDALSSLPARFPDGRPLHQRTYPWLMSSFVLRNFKLLKQEPGRGLAWAQVALSCVLAWWIVPLTLMAFWARFLVRRSLPITSLHIVLIVIAVWLAQWFWRVTRNTLRGVVPAGESKRDRILVLGRILFVSLAAGALTIVFAVAAVLLREPSPLEYSLAKYAWSPFGDLRGADLKGAKFEGRNLHGIHARGVLAANEDFFGCDLAF
ncbi:MAG: pentapeptide repeat-containing protein, partial [Bryobacterales bacterium]|nr:pentapeptide repeat-containing protein [Bryobacterales bacterium]